MGSGLVKQRGNGLANECSGKEWPIRIQLPNKKLACGTCSTLLTLLSSSEQWIPVMCLSWAETACHFLQRQLAFYSLYRKVQNLSSFLEFQFQVQFSQGLSCPLKNWTCSCANTRWCCPSKWKGSWLRKINCFLLLNRNQWQEGPKHWELGIWLDPRAKF